MYGTPASDAIFATRSAIVRACASDSMTHGPAIRNSGLPPPSRSDPSAISRVVVIDELKISQTCPRPFPPNQTANHRGGSERNQAAAWGVARRVGACGLVSPAEEPGVGRDFCSLCSSDAPMNAANSGCGSNGLDLNSGWNWQPRNQGWLGASTIST